MQRVPRVVAAVGALGVVLGLASCSSAADASNVSCKEWANSDSHARQQIERNLLKAHDLEKNSVGNVTGLYSALMDFCGYPDVIQKTGKGLKNGSRPIEEAVDWNSRTWS